MLRPWKDLPSQSLWNSMARYVGSRRDTTSKRRRRCADKSDRSKFVGALVSHGCCAVKGVSGTLVGCWRCCRNEYFGNQASFKILICALPVALLEEGERKP